MQATGSVTRRLDSPSNTAKKVLFEISEILSLVSEMSSYGSEIGSSLRNALIHKLLLYVAGFATLNMLSIQSNKAPQRVEVRLQRVGHTPHQDAGIHVPRESKCQQSFFETTPCCFWA